MCIEIIMKPEAQLQAFNKEKKILYCHENDIFIPNKHFLCLLLNIGDFHYACRSSLPHRPALQPALFRRYDAAAYFLSFPTHILARYLFLRIHRSKGKADIKATAELKCASAASLPAAQTKWNCYESRHSRTNCPLPCCNCFINWSRFRKPGCAWKWHRRELLRCDCAEKDTSVYTIRTTLCEAGIYQSEYQVRSILELVRIPILFTTRITDISVYLYFS